MASNKKDKGNKILISNEIGGSEQVSSIDIVVSQTREGFTNFRLLYSKNKMCHMTSKIILKTKKG